MISARIRASGRLPAALQRGCSALALALACLGAHSQEAAIVKRATELREQPSDASRSVASLGAEASVTRTGERRGPWVQVRSNAGPTGWVHLFDLGSPPAAGGVGNAATGALRSVTSFFSSSPQKYTTPTSTIGIRGLGAEDLAQAQPDLGAVGKMEALRQNERQARDFATRSSLAPVNVEPLPAPSRASGLGLSPGSSPSTARNPETAP